MKELSRPTATLREEDTLIEISSRGVFTRIIRFEHRLPTAKGMRPARRTASQQTWHKVQNAARFSTSLLGLVCYLIIKKDRMRMSVLLITDFTELTLLKLVGPVCIETNLGNHL